MDDPQNDQLETYAPHPAAELFPTLSDKEYAALKDDIERHGLLEAIWLYDGKVLDGRNRYRACRELSIEPRFREYKGDSPVAFVWSANGTRRHLSTRQLAAVAVKMVPALAEEARKRQATSTGGAHPQLTTNLQEAEKGEAAAQAAAIVGVSTSAVYHAKRVKETDPALFKRIEAGEVSINRAMKIITGKDTEPREKRAKITKVRKLDPRRVIENTIESLCGYETGLKAIEGGFDDFDADEAGKWADRLTELLKPLHRLRKQLRSIETCAQGKARRVRPGLQNIIA